jgi:putative tryptophan/tyrosine transport system substrate-binding protein
MAIRLAGLPFIIALILFIGFAGLVVPRAGEAQRTAKIPQMGFLDAVSPDVASYRADRLRAGLRELGYVEGKNIVIEYRWADGKYERLPGPAAQLVQLKVDVIVAASTIAIQAAQGATTTIPIVMCATADPVASGFVKSLSRPGGNITGLSNLAQDLSNKYLELLRVAVPGLSRVSLLVNPGHPSHPFFSKNISAAAQTTGVTVSPVEANTVSRLDAAFGSMKQERAGPVMVLPDAFSSSKRAGSPSLPRSTGCPRCSGPANPCSQGDS